MSLNNNIQSNTRTNFTLGACLFISIILLVLPLQKKVYVADFLNDILTKPYWTAYDFIVDVSEVNRVNNELHAQIAKLKMNTVSVERVRRERDMLRDSMGLTSQGNLDLIPCEIMSRELAQDARLVKLRCPVAPLWKECQPVVSVDGLFGRVLKTTAPNEAWIELLTSPDVAVGCELSRNGLLGVLQPVSGKFELGLVGRDEDVMVGDLVVTSGITEMYISQNLEDSGMPRGIPVGRVIEVSSPPDRLFKSILVEPLASFDKLDVVFLVVGTGDWFMINEDRSNE
jgi:rod shape-determining protein MreC